jgi:hypothetical protein
MGLLSMFRRRDDEEAVRESVQTASTTFGAARRFHTHPVYLTAVERWQLTDEQKEFLLRLLEMAGPILVLLLKAMLKV